MSSFLFHHFPLVIPAGASVEIAVERLAGFGSDSLFEILQS